MSMLIKWRDGRAEALADPFTTLEDDQPVPPGDVPGDVIVSLTRFQTEGEDLLAQGRRVGVRLAPDEAPEALAYDLPRIAVVALTFPKFRDGRAYSAARVLREPLHFTGEVRAVGDVLREQIYFMLRCGFDAFVPADGATAHEVAAAARRYRHVYQRAADGLEPAFVQRAKAA